MHARALLQCSFGGQSILEPDRYRLAPYSAMPEYGRSHCPTLSSRQSVPGLRCPSCVQVSRLQNCVGHICILTSIYTNI